MSYPDITRHPEPCIEEIRGPMSVYKYVNWQGKVIDLSDWISPEMPKEAVAQIARQKGRTHALKRAIQSLRNAGYRPDEIQQMTQWILSGRTLAGIGG